MCQMRISVKCTSGQFLAWNWSCCLIHFWFYFVGVSPCVFPPCVLLPALTHLPDVSHLCASLRSVGKKPDLPAYCCLHGGSRAEVGNYLASGATLGLKSGAGGAGN